MYSRISQPEKKLKAFQRFPIPAGEIKQYRSLPYPSLCFLNEKLQTEIEAGEFEFFVGTNSQEGIPLRFSVN